MCGNASVSRVQMAVVALVACACLEVCLAEAQSDLFAREGRTYSRSSAGTYCGSRLSEALKFMCNGNYNSYFKTKKTPPPGTFEDRNTYRVGHVSEIVEEYWAPPVQLPFRERLRAAAFLESRTRIRRGVFDECCSKSCTIDELMSYCEKRD